MKAKVLSCIRFTNKNGKKLVRTRVSLPDGTETVLHDSVEAGAAKVTRDKLVRATGLPADAPASDLVQAMIDREVEVIPTSEAEREASRAAGASAPDEWRLAGGDPEDDKTVDF